MLPETTFHQSPEGVSSVSIGYSPMLRGVTLMKALKGRYHAVDDALSGLLGPCAFVRRACTLR